MRSSFGKMRRTVRFFALLIALAAALPAGVANAASPSQAAHLCAGNGYRSFQRADGTGFQNPGECISYAVHTGTLQEVLGAQSVLRIIGGAGSCDGPDANGDLICFEGAGGKISGTFTTPTSDDSAFFSYDNHYVWHADGSAAGVGTAVCSGCVVAGRTGEVDFTTTGIGQGTQSTDLPFLILSSGTWRISSATSALTGLSGSGTWLLDPTTLDHAYAGTITLPV